MTVESGGVFCLGKESLSDSIIFALLLHDLLGRQIDLSYNVDQFRQLGPPPLFFSGGKSTSLRGSIEQYKQEKDNEEAI